MATSSPLRSGARGKPEHPVEGEGAIEITHADADVIDPLDCDGLGNCELRASVDTVTLYKRRSGCPVQRCPDPRLRFIVAHSEHAALRLGPGPGTSMHYTLT